MYNLENVAFYKWYRDVYPAIRQDQYFNSMTVLASIEREVENLSNGDGDLESTLKLIRSLLHAAWENGYVQGFSFYRFCLLSELFNQEFPEDVKNPFPSE